MISSAVMDPTKQQATKILQNTLKSYGAKTTKLTAMPYDTVKAVVQWRKPPIDWMSFDEVIEEDLSKNLEPIRWRVIGSYPEPGKFEIGPAYGGAEVKSNSLGALVVIAIGLGAVVYLVGRRSDNTPVVR